MWVVKIGGSLETSEMLGAWLAACTGAGAGRVVLVPGGGQYADGVREEQERHGFSDDIAHFRALEAMEQYAGVLMKVQPGLVAAGELQAIRQALEKNSSPLWMPVNECRDDSSIPRNWNTSSDSLAAWLAIKLQFPGLVLVKSAPLPRGNPTLGQLAACGLVDSYLPGLVENSGLVLHYLFKDDLDGFSALLQGRTVASRRTPGGLEKKTPIPC